MTRNEAQKEDEKMDESKLQQSPLEKETNAGTATAGTTNIMANIRQNAGNNDAAREMVPDNDGR